MNTHNSNSNPTLGQIVGFMKFLDANKTKTSINH